MPILLQHPNPFRQRRRWLGALRASAILSTSLGGLGLVSPARAQLFEETGQIEAPTNAEQLVYLPSYGTLVLRNSASAVAVVRITDESSTNHAANTRFLDLSASQDEAYVYVADYGGENIGYGTPSSQHYVHRLNVATGEWDVKNAYLAGRIEATTDGRFALMSLDQWITITHNEWGQGTAVTELAQTSWTVYSGDMQYDAQTGRLLHGNAGISSPEVQAFKLDESSIITQEGSGTYGTADGYGGTAVLATDGSLFYYGQLSVDALDVASNRVVFSELIYAATGDVAFGGDGRYFDSRTGDELGSLGFETTALGLSRQSCDFWAYDGSSNLLRHFEPTAAYDGCQRPEPAQPDAGGTNEAVLDAGNSNVPQTISANDTEPEADAATSSELQRPEDGAVQEATATEAATTAPSSSEHAAIDGGILNTAGDADTPEVSSDADGETASHLDASATAQRATDAGARHPTSETPPPCGAEPNERLEERGCNLGPAAGTGSLRSTAVWTLLALSLTRVRRRPRVVALPN